MTHVKKTALLFLLLSALACFLFACNKTYKTCAKPEDKRVTATIALPTGNISIDTKIWFTPEVGFHYEYASNASYFGLGGFEALKNDIMALTTFKKEAGEKTIAFNLYKRGELHTDSLIKMEQIVGVSRYFVNKHKMYHQFFMMEKASKKLSEITSLNAEVDGVVTNYNHTIFSEVLDYKESFSSIFFFDASFSTFDRHLENPKDELEWKLNMYLHKKKLAGRGSMQQ